MKRFLLIENIEAPIYGQYGTEGWQLFETYAEAQDFAWQRLKEGYPLRHYIVDLLEVAETGVIPTDQIVKLPKRMRKKK